MAYKVVDLQYREPRYDQELKTRNKSRRRSDQDLITLVSGCLLRTFILIIVPMLLILSLDTSNQRLRQDVNFNSQLFSNKTIKSSVMNNNIILTDCGEVWYNGRLSYCKLDIPPVDEVITIKIDCIGSAYILRTYDNIILASEDIPYELIAKQLISDNVIQIQRYIHIDINKCHLAKLGDVVTIINKPPN